jgi:hypothetical protein
LSCFGFFFSLLLFCCPFGMTLILFWLRLLTATRGGRRLRLEPTTTASERGKMLAIAWPSQATRERKSGVGVDLNQGAPMVTGVMWGFMMEEAKQNSEVQTYNFA